MMTHRLARKFLWMVPLLLTILACNITAQWTGSHITIKANQPAFPPSQTTALSEAACTALPSEILRAATSSSPAGSASMLLGGSQEVDYLVVYNLNGDELGKREDLIVPAIPDPKVDSRVSHEHIWNYFRSLIPAGDRSFVTEFSILSDGSNNILAGVSPTYHDPNKWTLKVDVVDAGDRYSLTYSLLHEFGHLLTLNASQVPPNDQVFYHPEDRALREQAVTGCPRYFSGDGCSNTGSYMNEFFNRFWGSLYQEWQHANDASNEDVQRALLYDFYQDHEDQFLTSYAATSPEEDIAESWAYFILFPKPEATSVTDQKILFFYEDPELVALRQEILSRLCTSFSGS